jgi:hypothetical protein
MLCHPVLSQKCRRNPQGCSGPAGTSTQYNRNKKKHLPRLFKKTSKNATFFVCHKEWTIAGKQTQEHAGRFRRTLTQTSSCSKSLARCGPCPSPQNCSVSLLCPRSCACSQSL